MKRMKRTAFEILARTIAVTSGSKDESNTFIPGSGGPAAMRVSEDKARLVIEIMRPAQLPWWRRARLTGRPI